MNENQSNAKNLIDGLLQQAATDPDFKAWKEAHPDPDPEFTAMTKEEQIQHIIGSLDELGLVIHEDEKPKPEPEQELTAEELQAQYDNMTDEEQKDFIEHCVFVGGFEKVIDEVQAGQHKNEIDRITKYFCIPDKSAMYGFAMYYAAGVNHGFELACKAIGAENENQKPTKAATRAEKTARILSILEEYGIIDPEPQTEAGGAEK